MRTLTDDNAEDASTMREMNIDLPEGTEVFVVLKEWPVDAEPMPLMIPLTHIKIVMPEVQ